MRRTRLTRYPRAGLDVADAYEVFAGAYLHHVSNDEYYGRPFLLEPWQRDMLWRPLLASGRMEGGRFVRRYRRALLGLPRGYGKTELAAAIVMTLAVMEPVQMGQYCVVADSEEQAGNCLAKLKAMVRLDSDLSDVWEVQKGLIRNRETDAEIKVMPYKESALQSWHFNVAVLDEMHVYRSDAVWNAVVSGQKVIPNALLVGITTASAERRGFLWDLYSRVAAGGDPSCYLCWIGLDDADDASDERGWRKVLLPSWVSAESLREQRGSMTAEAFERYQLNRFPARASASRLMSRADLAACRAQAGDIDWGRYFAVGLDGATGGDTLAVCAYQRGPGGEDLYAEWAWDVPDERGLYDLVEVADVLESLARRPGRPLLVADPARMAFLTKYLERERGVGLFALPQQARVMCPATSLLTRAVKSRSARMAATPVLADHCGNAVNEPSRAYGDRLSSEAHGQGSARIDMAVAAAMAMWAYDNAERPADFSSGGVWDIEL